MVVGAVLALALAACGSDSGESQTTAGATLPAQTQAGEATATKADPEVAALVPPSLKGEVIDNAIYNDGAPQQFLEDGELVGIQPDFAEAAAALMGLKFNTVPVGSFDSIIPGLQSGRYDVAFADFGITAEREKVVDFVEQFTLGTSFGVKSGSGTTIGAPSDLCGLTLGTLAGSYFLDQLKTIDEQCASDGKPPIDVQSYPTQSAAVLAVANGRTDAYATSTDQLAYAADQTKGAMEVQPLVYEPIPQGIGLPKGSPLAKPLQAAIRAMIANGEYQRILDKWGIGASAITADEVRINPITGGS
jgi:polar amino acid transport system substrate-binding protein